MFDDQAKKVLFTAKSIAIYLGIKQIKVEHVLAALLMENTLQEYLELGSIAIPKDLTEFIEQKNEIIKIRSEAHEKLPFESSLKKILNRKETGPLSEILSQTKAKEAGAIHLAGAILRADVEISRQFLKQNNLSIADIKTKVREEFGTKKDEQNRIYEAAILLNKVNFFLKKKVFGQDAGIDALLTGYFQQVLFDQKDSAIRRPASFVFLGDSGTGKTLLAETLPDALRHLGYKRPVKRFSMTNYMSEQHASHLIGIPAPFVSPQEGHLTGFVRKHPNAIIILDEFDRAHEQAHNILLRILDEGVCEDLHSKKLVSFKNNLFILTTNAGRGLYQNTKTFGYFKDLGSIPRHVVGEVLRKELPPASHALIDRISEFNIFPPLGFQALRQICQKGLNIWRQKWQKNNMEIMYRNEQDIITAILLNGGLNSSGRAIEHLITSCLDRPITKWMLKYQEELKHLSRIDILIRDTEGLLNVAGKKISVLWIDDDPNYLEKTIPLLEDICDVQVAHTTGEARKRLREYPSRYGLILLDLNLSEKVEYGPIPGSAVPFPNTLRLLKHIRQNYTSIPVYIHSGHLSSQDDEIYAVFVDCGGAAGIVPKELRNKAPLEFVQEIDRLRSEILWEKHCLDYFRRGQRLNFSVLPVTSSTSKSKLLVRIDGLRFETSPIIEDLQWFSVAISDCSFESLVGVEKIRQKLEEAIEYLKDPAAYAAAGVKPPMGYILHGGPGTGKTSIAKAVAREADALFIGISATIFERKYVGEGPRMIRDLFRVARKYSPVIVFIDEIDALGKRSAAGDGASRSQTSIINTLLECMDGFEINDGVLFIAATNYIEHLDPALLRPGRFTRHLELAPLENSVEIQQLIFQTLHNIPGDRREELARQLAGWLIGLSPAQIVDIVNEGGLIAKRKGDAKVEMEHLLEARNIIMFGEQRAEDIDRNERLQTAQHEAGHTLIAKEYGIEILQVSIVSRRRFSGFMEQQRDSDRAHRSRKQILQEIDILLGGLAVGKVYQGEPISGADNDLMVATRLALGMLYQWGMMPDKGIASIAIDETPIIEIAKIPELWNPVQEILGQRIEQVEEILTNRKDALDCLVNEIIKKENLTQEQIDTILKPWYP